MIQVEILRRTREHPARRGDPHCRCHDAEIPARIEILRRAKAALGSPGAEIPLAILDRLLEPIDCRRTRDRLRRLERGLPDVPNVTAYERDGRAT
jgi:hypothetical protein